MKKFEHILALVNDQAASWPALNRATDMAWRHGAKLTAVAVHEPTEPRDIGPGSWSRELDAAIHEHLHHRLNELLGPFRDAGHRIVASTSIGSPLEVVSEIMGDEPFDLLIKGALASTDQASPALAESDRILLESCPSPVWFEPTTSRENLGRVIAALDPFSHPSSALNQAIMTLGTGLARRDGADLEIIIGKQRIVATSRDPQGLLDGIEPIPVVGSERAKAEVYCQQVIDSARHTRPGLMVMGSSIDELPDGLGLADTTDRLLRTARPAVLTLKPDTLNPRLRLLDAA